MSSVFFPFFFRKRSFKSRQNPRVDFFQARKDFKGFKRVLWSMDFFQLPFIRLERPFRELSVSQQEKFSLYTKNKFGSKCLQKFYVSSKQEKQCYMKTTSYLEEPNRHFYQHFMRRTTQQTFSATNVASQQKTIKLFFSSHVSKQFKL